MLIELLESRIAPAAVITFTDLDGDLVTISSSKGTVAELQNAAGDLSDHILQGLSLIAPVYRLADISITAQQAPSMLGDGHVNVGYISSQHDLGALVVDGDLAAIGAGDNIMKTGPALKSLRVLSFGAEGTSTGAANLISRVHGNVGSIYVQTNMESAEFYVDGPDQGRIGSVYIGGSFIGDTTEPGARAGHLGAYSIGSIFVGGDLVGGSKYGSGTIGASYLGTMVVKGSLLGGSGTFSGGISTYGVGLLSIGGDVVGGGGINSGNIVTQGPTGKIAIHGSVIGGPADYSGALFFEGTAASITVGGSLVGAAGRGTGSIDAKTNGDGTLSSVNIVHNVLGGAGDDSGAVFSGGRLKSMVIGGELVGGDGNRSGRISGGVAGLGVAIIRHDIRGGHGAGIDAGEVTTTGTLGTVYVGGSLLGGAAANNGFIFGTKGIGAVTVVGDVAGGTGAQSGSIFTNVGDGGKIGTVTIGGNLLGGSANTGRIYADGDLSVVRIGGNLEAGTGDASGYIEGRHIGSVAITGFVSSTATTALAKAAQISARTDIGSVLVIGAVRSSANDPVVLVTAAGSATPTATTDLAIGKVTVGGNFFGTISAGVDPLGTLTNANAQIGAILIKGSIDGASLITAGTVSATPPAAGISKIASVIIGGTAGDVTIAAHQIAAFQVGHALAPLTTGADTIDMGLGGLIKLRDSA
jgi:hypothetical protein